MTASLVASALGGGVLIGVSALALLALAGRTAGISSILGGLIAGPSGERLWRFVFLAGLVGGAACVYAFSGPAPAARGGFPAPLLALAGLLVGYGTSLANGCTSGHGVCGLGRFSVRSLAAVSTFLITGIVTTFVVRHVIGVAS